MKHTSNENCGEGQCVCIFTCVCDSKQWIKTIIDKEILYINKAHNKLNLGVMKFTHQHRVKLLCLYHDLQHGEETVWGSSLYIEVNNRHHSVATGFPLPQTQRIKTLRIVGCGFIKPQIKKQWNRGTATYSCTQQVLSTVSFSCAHKPVKLALTHFP